MKEYLTKIEQEIISLGFKIESKDFDRPWGGFLVIDEIQAQEFSDKFYICVFLYKIFHSILLNWISLFNFVCVRTENYENKRIVDQNHL